MEHGERELWAGLQRSRAPPDRGMGADLVAAERGDARAVAQAFAVVGHSSPYPNRCDGRREKRNRYVRQHTEYSSLSYRSLFYST